MKKSSYVVAFGGIISAICLSLEFAIGIFPAFIYVFPMVCSLLMTILLDECGTKACAAAYASISILSLLICPDKEGAMLYAAFFGYYPIARQYIAKIPKKVLRIIIKLFMFNLAMVCTYLILIKIFGISDAAAGESATWIWAAILLLGNIAFLLFDVALVRILNIYTVKYKSKIFKGGRKR